MVSLKKLNETYDTLKIYDGNNPYILMLKRDVFVNKQAHIIGDFQIEYIEKNKDFQPISINKMTKLADWYAEKKKTDWGVDFLPEKVKIITLLGETDTTYHCYVKYRQSVPPVMCFLPKKAILKNFLLEDYRNYQFDYRRYDRISMEKDIERKLLEHQKEGIKFLLSRKKCILADGQGTGKTTTLSVAAIEGNFDSVVIICPASLKYNWANELKWYVPSRDITILESFIGKTKNELEVFLGYTEGKSGKKRDELLEEANEKGKWESNRFIILNYDILDEFYKLPSSRSKENVSLSFKESPLLRYIFNRKSLIIIDEAHKLSNSTSGRYKIIKSLIKKGNPDSIYLATGTPITNNPQNLYSILNLLDDPVTSDWNYFMKRYCGAKEIVSPKDKEKRNAISEKYIASKGKSTWFALTNEEKDELQEKIKRNCKMMTIAQDATNLDELKDRISHIYLRRVKEDVANLPPKIIHECHYQLTSSQQYEYNKLWDEYEAAKRVENPDIELNQDLLEGGIYRRYLAFEMVEKTIKLTEKLLLDEPDCKVVIFCCFDDEIYALKEHFGDKAVLHNGKLNLKQKDKAVSDFQKDENVKIFLGNIISAGVGITLIRGNKLIFNDFDFVTGNNEQCEDRVHRIGQTKQCDIYYQFFDDTQYEHMWDIVLKKSFNINQIIKKETEK